jgi:hypothetical protein
MSGAVSLRSLHDTHYKYYPCNECNERPGAVRVAIANLARVVHDTHEHCDDENKVHQAKAKGN